MVSDHKSYIDDGTIYSIYSRLYSVSDASVIKLFERLRIANSIVHLQ